MLEPIDKKVTSLLCCPCSLRAEIKQSEDGKYKCRDTSCPRAGKAFPQISAQPILIDFKQSLCEEQSYSSTEDGSVLNRKHSQFRKFIHKIFLGENKVTIVNASRFICQLPNDTKKPTVLVIGGGAVGNGAEELYNNPNVNLIGFDIYATTVTDFVADAHSIPIKDASIDGVWIQAVLEHVLEPVKVVSEIHRVLKPGGIIYAETPFMQQVHEKAYDFTRFTESGHRWLFKEFDLIDSGVVLGAGTALLWSILYFTSALLRSRKAGAIIGYSLFWLRYFDNIMPEDFSSNAASSLFFMGKKSDYSLNIHEIVPFYRGPK